MAYFEYGKSGNQEGTGEQVMVFNGLSEEEWQVIIRNAQNISFSQGEVLLRAGEVDDAVYIVMSGRVEVVSERAFGLFKRIATIDKGSVFGEVSFFDSQPRSASIRAATDGQVMRLSHKNFEKICAWNPKLAQQFLLDLGRILALRFRGDYPHKV